MFGQDLGRGGGTGSRALHRPQITQEGAPRRPCQNSMVQTTKTLTPTTGHVQNPPLNTP